MWKKLEYDLIYTQTISPFHVYHMLYLIIILPTISSFIPYHYIIVNENFLLSIAAKTNLAD